MDSECARVCDVADVRYAITGTGADKQRHVDVRDDTRSSRDASADGRELRGYDRRCAQRL
jgi:hypothetical protein